jgi:hypothetical protein
MMRPVDCRCATSKFSWDVEVEGVSPLGQVVQLTRAVGYLLPWTVVVPRMLEANTNAVLVCCSLALCIRPHFLLVQGASIAS